MIGTFWSPDLGWLLVEVVLAYGGHSRLRAGHQIQIDPRLLRLAGGIPATDAAMTRQLISDGYQPAKTIFRDWPNLRADGCFLEDAG